MSEPLVVTIPHKLGREEALRRVKPALSKASESFPCLRWSRKSGRAIGWSSECGRWAGGGRQHSGGRDDVRLEVTLPWLLHKFGQVVQKTIAGKGQILLEKK